MNAKEWIEKRTSDELISHYAVLRHLPQIDFMGYHYRGLIKQELQSRATELGEFMHRMDKSE